MGRALAREIKTAPTGLVMQQLMADQAALITSLPIEAAERIQRLATENLQYSSRGDEMIREIMRTGEVTKSRATLIARTETARATSVLTQARAQHVGSEGYIWRTAKDEIVRTSHRLMEGEYVRWDTMPRLSDGTRTHAGCFFNCRCYPEPVIPDIYG
jgi:SPP1 gp7 family putative phage head morphogenesis protein